MNRIKKATCHSKNIYTVYKIASTIKNPDLTPEKMLAVTISRTSSLIANGKFVIAFGL